MDVLDIETIQNEIVYRKLEAECEELSNEWKENVAVTAVTMKKTTEYQVKANALINDLDKIQRRNQESKRVVAMVRQSLDKLKEHSTQQMERCKQLSSATEGMCEKLKELLATSKVVSVDIPKLKSQINELSGKIEAQAEKTEQNTAFIEAEHVRLDNDYMQRLQKCRTDDATIQANDNELKSLVAALNQQKETLAKVNQQRTDSENVSIRTAKQMRLVEKNIESLRSERRRCESDHQKLQQMELEKSSLRKEIDFYTKTARKMVSKTDRMTAAGDEPKNIDKAPVNLSSNTMNDGDDFMRDILLINPLPRSNSAALNTSGSISTEIEFYGAEHTENA